MKVLLLGVAAAVAAGAMAGDAMRPVLVEDAPPMQAAGWGAGLPAAAEPAGVWTRPGPAPDYVIGTDWLPDPPTPPTESFAPEPPVPSDFEAYAYGEYDPWPPMAARLEADAGLPPPTRYPSEHGDILSGAEDRPALAEPADAPGA